MKQILMFILILILITNTLNYKEHLTMNCKSKKNIVNNKNEVTFECVEKLSLLKSLNNTFKKYKYLAYIEYKKQKDDYKENVKKSGIDLPSLA